MEGKNERTIDLSTSVALKRLMAVSREKERERKIIVHLLTVDSDGHPSRV